MSELKTGRELDTLIAEKVMGWKWFPCEMNPHQKILSLDEVTAPKLFIGQAVIDLVPRYSTDIAAAWEVVEKLHAEGLQITYTPSNGWFVELGTGHYMENSNDIEMTFPLAACLAALKAVEGK